MSNCIQKPEAWAILLLMQCSIGLAQLQPGVPSGWQRLITGNQDSRLLVTQGAENACVLEAAPGGTIGVRAGMGDLPWLLVAATVPKLPVGVTVGVFINTSNGAMLKLELKRDGARTHARFMSMAGQRLFGEHQTDVPTSGTELLLVRQADGYRAGVRTNGALKQIGILEWPDLPVEGLAGVYATTGADASGSLRVQVTDIALHNAEWYYGRAMLLMQNHDYDTATATLDESIGLFGPVPFFYQAKAWVAAARGDYRAEKAAWQQAVLLDPNDPECLNALAWTMVEHADDLPTAEQLSRRANLLFPATPPLMDTLAWIRHRQGQTDEAIIILEEALDQVMAASDNNDIHINLTLFDHLATIYAERHETVKERQVHQRLVQCIGDVEADTLEPLILAARGWSYFRLGRTETALSDLRMAEIAIEAHDAMHVEDVQIMERLGDVLVATEQRKAAMKAYAQALTLAQHLGQHEAIKRLQEKTPK